MAFKIHLALLSLVFASAVPAAESLPVKVMIVSMFKPEAAPWLEALHADQEITVPGLPLELTVDLVHSPDQPGDVAFFGLGRGWWLLAALTLSGLVAGLLWGWISRWRIAVWRTN